MDDDDRLAGKLYQIQRLGGIFAFAAGLSHNQSLYVINGKLLQIGTNIGIFAV